MSGGEALEMPAVEEDGLALIEYPDIHHRIEQRAVDQTREERGSHDSTYALFSCSPKDFRRWFALSRDDDAFRSSPGMTCAICNLIIQVERTDSNTSDSKPVLYLLEVVVSYQDQYSELIHQDYR
jgi:hypothetical protein